MTDSEFRKAQGRTFGTTDPGELRALGLEGPGPDLRVFCHGCAQIWNRPAGFFSSPLAQKIGNMVFPVMGCPACMKIPGRIREAYERWTGTK